MIVTIHQPVFAPWPAFFAKMKAADLFVFLDTASYKKGGYHNRNRIVDAPRNRARWLTVPIQKCPLGTALADVEIAHKRWKGSLWRKIADAYDRHPYWALYRDELHDVVFAPHERLVSLNFTVIGTLARWLGVDTPFVFASNIEAAGSATERLVSICQEVGADAYLAGAAAGDYLDESLFEAACIHVDHFEYEPPVYTSPCYVPGLSALDLLMSCGPLAKDAI